MSVGELGLLCFASYKSLPSCSFIGEGWYCACVSCLDQRCRRMESGVKDVFAAGDACCLREANRAEHWFQMRLWTQVSLMSVDCTTLKHSEALGRAMAMA